MEREQTAAFVGDDVLEKSVNMYMQLIANVEKQMKIIKLQDCKVSRFCYTSLYFDYKSACAWMSVCAQDLHS